MAIQQALRPKQALHFKATAALTLGFVAAYLLGSRGWLWSPKRGVGLFFGFLAALLFLFEMGYPLRRSRARPLGTAQRWVQAHVYLGFLGFMAVLTHMGFTWPRGWFGWALLGLAFWTTATGLLGVFLQKWIPVQICDSLKIEALYERLPSLVDGLRAEADVLMEGASDRLESFYRTQVREPMSRLQPFSWAYVLDPRAGRDRALEPFRRISQFVEVDEKEVVDDLMSIYTEKMELDAQYTLQSILRRWLLWTVHVPAGALLIALTFVHVFTWAWY